MTRDANDLRRNEPGRREHKHRGSAAATPVSLEGGTEG